MQVGGAVLCMAGVEGTEEGSALLPREAVLRAVRCMLHLSRLASGMASGVLLPHSSIAVGPTVLGRLL